MKTFVRNTALTLVAFALALILPNTASAACEGFADVPEDAACYGSERDLRGGSSGLLTATSL